MWYYYNFSQPFVSWGGVTERMFPSHTFSDFIRLKDSMATSVAWNWKKPIQHWAKSGWDWHITSSCLRWEKLPWKSEIVLLLMRSPRSRYLRIFINLITNKHKVTKSCDLMFKIFMRWHTLAVSVILEVWLIHYNVVHITTGTAILSTMAGI